MPLQYIPPDRVPFTGDLTRHVRTAALVGLGILAVLILWFAATAKQADETPPPLPTQTLDQAGVAEHRLTLTDGRTLLCLTFPDPGAPASCDWSRAYRGLT